MLSMLYFLDNSANFQPKAGFIDSNTMCFLKAER